MEIIIYKLKKLDGNNNFAMLRLIDTEMTLYLLFQDKSTPILIYSILIQHKPSNLKDQNIKSGANIFIAALDTTGFFHPRKDQSYYTQNFTKCILEDISPNFIEIFSHPKSELIFGKSSLNNLKGCLKTENLLEYWLKILKSLSGNDKICVYSDHYYTKSIPYDKETPINKIFMFEDDPKSKMWKNIGGNMSINEFYQSLLIRRDVSKGGFLYSLKKKPVDVEYPSINCDCVSDVLKYLRDLDFSNLENSKESSFAVYEKYKNHIKWFSTSGQEMKRVSEEKSNVIKLKTRKKGCR